MCYMYDFETYWIIYLLAAIFNGVIWGLVCKAIISVKGYDESKQKSYFWVGFFIGIIGVIIAAVNPQNTAATAKETSKSKSDNKYEGKWKCSYCGYVNFNVSSECACGKTRRESENHLRYLSQSSKTDNLDALKKLKELLDTGAITQDEFDLMKSNLLK